MTGGQQPPDGWQPPSQPMWTPQPKRAWPTWVGVACVAAFVVAAGALYSNDGFREGMRSANRDSGQAQAGGRPGAFAADIERRVGEPADVGGYTATVRHITFREELNAIKDDGGYLVVDVELQNHSTQSQRFTPGHWYVQTPTGQVLDSTISFMEGELGRGELVTGGTAYGHVAFEIGAVKGVFYAIFQPYRPGDPRALWAIAV